MHKLNISALTTELDKSQQDTVSAVSEKEASSSLFPLPLTRYGFNFTKSELRDVLALGYGWEPKPYPPNVPVEKLSLLPIPCIKEKEATPTCNLRYICNHERRLLWRQSRAKTPGIRRGNLRSQINMY